MSVLDEVRANNQELAHVLEKHPGIRKMVEDLYPDRAHFIYELLQNAEDADATEATFELTTDSVAFEHNGRPFDEDDVRAIMDIGEGTKKDQDNKIGRFGIGFKAVFAYTETPYIWSPTYSFKISDLVLPTAIPKRSELSDKTRFEFPFNNPKKPAQVAYEEIKAELEALAETTLLFLSHMTCIGWRIDSETSGCIIREQHSEHHIEVLKEAEQKETSSSHFLRFSAPIEGLPTQTVSVAFPLDFLPNVQKFDPAKPISRQLKIVPTTGRVSVYFPAEKETSGLRFHLHAPFVPELSRASIKDTSANEPLFKQLADLAATSLHAIRDLKLLTGEFLGVLPNREDPIPDRYKPIRDAIIDEMKQQPLTPTHTKAHASAKHLRQAHAQLKELLPKEDLRYLIAEQEEPFDWAIGATQKNSNQDRFLAGLEIRQWDIEQFVELLYKKCRWIFDCDPEFMGWLSKKSVEWHQQLYSLLYDYDKEVEGRSGNIWGWRKRQLPFVRRTDGSYCSGPQCYFPSDGTEHDTMLPRVDARVYTSGKNKKQQENAKELLKELGVREVGEAEQVESILEQRYVDKVTPSDDTIYWKDFNRFMALFEKEPARAAIFNSSYIFILANKEMGRPSEIFLDSPYQNTGLTAYFDGLDGFARKWPLSKSYKGQGIPNDRLKNFAEAVGIQTKLEVTPASCYDNPKWDYLKEAPGERARSPKDEDYTIARLDEALASPSIELSKLVWHTMCELSGSKLKARYQKIANGSRYADSQIVHLLRNAKWVPQGEDRFVSPADASRALLPKGFPFDEGYEWLKAVRFGENERQQSEESKRRQATAKKLGFVDERTLLDAQWFAGLDPEERQRVKDEVERKRQFDLPEHEPRNARRRDERVTQRAKDALERISELRRRSVSVGWEAVKQEAEPYLIEQYTNQYEEMFCQVCKAPLPFKLADGSYYFVMVEFLPELQNRHYQNYLALCPNHAAMYQYANGSSDRMEEMFMTMDGKELEVILAQQNATIYFTGTHAADLRAVIAADQGAKTKAGGA